mgnify:CR=1 FL=1
MQKRKFVPRGAESIQRNLDPERQEGSRTGTMPGDYCINPNLKNVRYERLRCYNGGRAVIRVWPMLDPTNPTESLSNGRISTQQTAGLAGMSISEPVVCVQYAGIKSESKHMPPGEQANLVSYVIARSDQQKFVVEGVPYWDEPYVKLYVTCKRAKDSGQFANGKAWDASWNPLMVGQMAELCVFKKRYFVVCSIYENGEDFNLTRERVRYRKNGQDVDKEYPRNGVALGDGAADPLVVLQLPISAGKKIFQLANLEKQDWQGDENADPAIMFKYGDPTGKFDPEARTVNGGVFFTLYNPTKLTIDKHTTFRGVVPPIVEYEAAVSSKFQAPNGSILPADMNQEKVANVLNKHVFFWKESDADGADSYLLHEPSIEQRCELIAKAFKPVPKLLEFAWMSHPEYLNFDSVAAILKNRRSTTVVKPTLEPEQEDDDFTQEEAPAPKAKPKAVLPPKPKAPVKSAADLANDFDDDEIDEDDLENDDAEDEDGEDTVVPAKSKNPKAAAKLQAASDDFDDETIEEDEDEDEDGDEDFPVSKSKKAGQAEDEFDDEKDNSEVNSTLEEQLNASMSKANAIARSRNRSSKPGK